MSTAFTRRPARLACPGATRGFFGLVALFWTATAPAQTAGEHLRLSAILDHGGRVQAGLLNTENQRTYLLAPGESAEGFELVSVDPRTERAVLTRDGASIVLRLRGGPPAPARAARAAASVAAPGPAPATAAGAGTDRQRVMAERAAVQVEMNRLRQELLAGDLDGRAEAIQAFEERMKERGHTVEAQDRPDGSLLVQVRGEGFAHMTVLGATSNVHITTGSP